jgi:hypothetical protein
VWNLEAERLGGIRVSENPPEAAESIVYAGLENMECIIGERIIIAEVHHVVLDLRSPVTPQCIFGTDAEHPAADGLVDRASATNPTPGMMTLLLMFALA